MGLDMYLYGVKKTSDPENYNEKYGTWEQIGYWRKANQVHKWFNNECIKEQDPWGIYEVEESKLQGLLVLCKTLKMLKDNKLDVIETDLLKKFRDVRQEIGFESGDNADYIAYALLPPDNLGCFFGSGVVDEDYWVDIDDTIKILTNAIKSDYTTYYYRASW